MDRCPSVLAVETDRTPVLFDVDIMVVRADSAESGGEIDQLTQARPSSPITFESTLLESQRHGRRFCRLGSKRASRFGEGLAMGDLEPVGSFLGHDGAPAEGQYTLGRYLTKSGIARAVVPEQPGLELGIVAGQEATTAGRPSAFAAFTDPLGHGLLSIPWLGRLD